MGAIIVWQNGAVVVTSVNPLGPAGASGEVLIGDQIIEVGGEAVTSVEQARSMIIGPSM
jgi:C-terminal processing protease CtpA/Prc